MVFKAAVTEVMLKNLLRILSIGTYTDTIEERFRGARRQAGIRPHFWRPKPIRPSSAVKQGSLFEIARSSESSGDMIIGVE